MRRAAARALGRIADARAGKLLRASLSDADGDVVAWSAFGVGRSCAKLPDAVRALVTRAASLADSDAGAPAPDRLDPVLAIADALARCGGSEAERTLAAWLDGPRSRAEHAALALGLLASHTQHLSDSSIIALLDAASSPEPLDNALFAFSRLSKLSPPVVTRLVEVASDTLASKGDARDYAVRALGRAGAAAAEQDPPLDKVVDGVADKLGALAADTGAASALRSAAARELSRLGPAGQRALAATLDKIAPGKDRPAPTDDGWGPLITTLDAVQPPVGGAAKVLVAIAELPVPPADQAVLRRRTILLRCNASALLAGSATLAKDLLACDPDKGGRSGALAMLRVLDRGKIEKARYRRWLALASSKDAVVREAAIGLMPAHAEIDKPAEPLAAALGAEEGGVVATAAQVLAAYPARGAVAPDAGRAGPAQDPKPEPTAIKPDPEVVKALTAAFERPRPPDAVEVRAALIDAAAALELLSFKPRILPYCASPVDYLRSHAEKAIRLMGDRTKQCPPPAAPSKSAEPPAAPGVVEIVLETDAGRLVLSLDGRLAPLAVARLRDLAKAGFFDGNVVHRVVPGFVAQFGDPGGDGYGGSGKTSLPSETSPLPFTRLSVGMALSGAGTDTGSSQLFVTLGPYPHLDGDYPLIGHASGDWDKLAQGDVIAKATVR